MKKVILVKPLSHKATIPACCRNCSHLTTDDTEFHRPEYWECDSGIWFPTYKRTCKRQFPVIP